ncbi:hypothetical protein M8J77_020247 [Diaphorina citri]|nr:hypothetical protein M8J77_020247 [Diaphorina citri]
MDLQVQKLLEHRVLVPNPFVSGFTSPLFLVPKGDGSKRPIINLKRLNQFLSLKKFHLINHFRVPDFLQRGDFLVKIDLSQAYFHVPIRPSHQRFLSVVYRDTLYCMTCLPFGLASAPQVFAKLTNWIANYLRNLGMRVIVYLDDLLLGNQDSVLLRSQARAAVATLQSLGWSVNLERSVLWPVQTCQYLGIMWNPTLDSKSLPLEKQSTIQRYLLTLTQIQWWSAALHRSSPIFPQAPQVFVSTDASNSGWGAIVDNHSLGGVWSDHQEMWHINLKEMFAVRSALERKLPVLQDKVVLIQSDNQTVVSYIHKEGGTKSFKLLREVEALFDLAVRHNITLMARYIPGKFNTWADSLSRQKELPDWHLLPEVTQHIFAQWGVPEIDLFATANSAVVPRFAALSTLDHQAMFVDAFSRKWDFSLAWVFPPPPLLPRVLHHLNPARGLYILVTPHWENAFWWPDLKARTLAPPRVITNLKKNLIDLATKRPPPELDCLKLQAFLVQGGPLKFPDGINPISTSYDPHGENQP